MVPGNNISNPGTSMEIETHLSSKINNYMRSAAINEPGYTYGSWKFDRIVQFNISTVLDQWCRATKCRKLIFSQLSTRQPLSKNTKLTSNNAFSNKINEEKKDMIGSNLVAGGIGVLFFLILYVGVIGLSIYMMILMIKLARRGIKALDIYINEKSSNKMY